MTGKSASNGLGASRSPEQQEGVSLQDKVELASLPKSGLMRLASIIGPGGPIPVSKSTWWAGVRSGRYPKPVKLGPRITAWRVGDIRALIDTGSSR
jgi:prophage regulatory protein